MGGACVPSVALVFAIAVPVLCLAAAAAVARRACLPEEEAAVRRGEWELRRRLEIRRRDGYVVGGEWAPVWMWWRREALVFLRRAHVKAAVYLSLLRQAPLASTRSTPLTLWVTSSTHVHTSPIRRLSLVHRQTCCFRLNFPALR